MIIGQYVVHAPKEFKIKVPSRNPTNAQNSSQKHNVIHKIRVTRGEP